MDKPYKRILPMNGQNSNTYEETFYIIPRYIRKLPGITLAYLDVYETIFQFWNKNKACFLGEESMCERTGYQRRIIYKALNFFEQHQELERIKKNGKRYLVRPMKIIETDCEVNDEKVIHKDSAEIVPTCTTVDPNVHNRALSTCTTVHHNIKKLNKENNSIVCNVENTIVDNFPSVSNKPPRTHKFNIYKNNPLSFDDATLKGYLDMRKAIKKPLTERAWELLNNEFLNAVNLGFTAQQCIDEAILNTWQGFKADWMVNRFGAKTQNKAYRSNLTTSAVPLYQTHVDRATDAKNDALCFAKLVSALKQGIKSENINLINTQLKEIYT